MKKVLFPILALALVLAMASAAIPVQAAESWVYNPSTGHYYALTEGGLSFSQAETIAQGWGGHLVTVNDRDEELWLREQFGSQEHFWIGFNDLDVEGSWEWVSGEPISYTNWAEGEPNNSNEEDAAVMNWDPYGPGLYGDGWNDLPIGVQERGIIEVAPSEVPVDIKPGSDSNPLNVNSKGVLPVAILGTAAFDAMTVNASTVVLTWPGITLPPRAEGVPPLRWAYEDVNGDGIMDIVLKYSMEVLAQFTVTNEPPGPLDMTLMGELMDGTRIEGYDTVRIINKLMD